MEKSKKIEIAYMTFDRKGNAVHKRKIVLEKNIAKVCEKLKEDGARNFAFAPVDGE